ncbi:MAG: hypothetical protein FWF92_11395 [Oscillospiraceae bacterium]|nr:hypothetical protein [Oscillospiraceae bacterium]
MSKEYFTENISEETIANMIDKALKFEKTSKNKNIKANLLKIIPAAAVVVFMIGVINILSNINFTNINNISENGAVASHGIEISLNTSEYDELGQMQELNENDDIADDMPHGGVLAIGYKDNNGEEAIRISRDCGATWYISNDSYDFDTYTLDADLSAIEWLTYDEFKVWVDDNRAELPYDRVEWYETALENMKNGGVNTVGLVIIGGEEIIFVFSVSEPHYVIEGYYDGETFIEFSFTEEYSEEEYAEQIALYEALREGFVATVTIGDEVIYATQEEQDRNFALMESNLAQYGTVMTNGSISKVIDYNVEYYVINGYGDPIVHDDGSVTYEVDVYSYRFESEDGDIMGFGGISYQLLYDLVRDYFNERIEDGKMTQEEADGILAGLSKENTREIIIVDSDGNIID